jgi:hypothetical protein
MDSNNNKILDFYYLLLYNYYINDITRRCKKMKIKKLNKIGNSFGIIIDKTVLHMLNIDVTKPICLSIENGKIIIEQEKD